MIRQAFCNELGGVFTAHEAKREYFALSPRPAKLHFFCADPACRAASQTGARVSCVNYKALPQEEAVAVHYREWDEHAPDCRAYVPDEPGASGKPVEATGTRSGRKKKDDSFQVFDPGKEDGTRPTGTATTGGTTAPGGSGDSAGGTGTRGPRVPGTPSASSVSSTGFVEDLAQLWEEAKKDPDVDALLDEQISVVGVGKDKLRFLFRHVSKATVGDGNRIWYGGARLKRYGQGFALSFFDPTKDGKPLSTYISSADVTAYRYRGMLLDVLDRADPRRYVTAFIWGEITMDERDGEKASLKPASLKHLYIVLPPAQPTAAGADGSSSDSSALNSQ